MAIYTTTLRKICEYKAASQCPSTLTNIDEIALYSHSLIFDPPAPIFDECYRTALECKIIRHFYFKEIGFETAGRFLFALNNRMREIMPYFNQRYYSTLLEYNPLYTKMLATEANTKGGVLSNIDDHTKRWLDSKMKGENLSYVSGDTQTTNTGRRTENETSENTNYRLFSDTPQGALTGVENQTYLTDATKTTDDGQRTATSSDSATGQTQASSKTTGNTSSVTTGYDDFVRKNQATTTTTTDYINAVCGYEGISGADLIQKYRNSFINVDMEVIHSLDDLFMGLWGNLE